MASPSKEEKVLKLILENSPLKEWHFEEIVREAKMTRAVANKWLKKYVKDGLLKRIKEKGRFPYFTAGSKNAIYLSWKRMYALEQLHKSGLIPKLLSLQKAKTIILFGSMSKGDWYKDSDIDIFIYGDPEGLSIVEYELKMHKDIELFICQNKNDLSKLGNGLLKNIIKGNLIKGDLDFISVNINA